MTPADGKGRWGRERRKTQNFPLLPMIRNYLPYNRCNSCMCNSSSPRKHKLLESSRQQMFPEFLWIRSLGAPAQAWLWKYTLTNQISWAPLLRVQVSCGNSTRMVLSWRRLPKCKLVPDNCLLQAINRLVCRGSGMGISCYLQGTNAYKKNVMANHFRYSCVYKLQQ